MSKTKDIEIPMRMCGWRSDGIVLNSCNGLERSYIIDLIKMDTTKSVKLVIEQEEPKRIQMTESDFVELINVVNTYANPVAELKSRFNNRKYHVRD